MIKNRANISHILMQIIYNVGQRVNILPMVNLNSETKKNWFHLKVSFKLN